MKLVKLDAITSHARSITNKYGLIWKVSGRTERPDPYHFQTRKPVLYLTPYRKPTRNPKVDIGDNYKLPTREANVGAMWIQEYKDPHFDWETPSRTRLSNL